MRSFVLLLLSVAFFCCPDRGNASEAAVDSRISYIPDTADTLSPADIFWGQLEGLCGKSFEGRLISPEADEMFAGKRLVMHVRECSSDQIRIPFFVGEDKSRTWILTKKEGYIELKHDHRHEDGLAEQVNMYGGRAVNTGMDTMQIFPADAHTAGVLPPAAANVWWVTLTGTTFTYNLRRVGTDRLFTVAFDLSETVADPGPPWGWEE